MIKHFNAEVNLCHHCNNRCASCNHLSPFAEPYYMSPAVLYRDLAIVSKLVHVELFNLQGGEPLLHPNILQCMDILADSGISDDPGILTNGRLLPQMEDAFWQKAHDRKLRITVTVYPNLPEGTIEAAQAKADQFGVNFRPANFPLPHFAKMLNPSDGWIWKDCPWKECWTIHEGYFFVCPIAPFMAPQFLDLPMETDGLKLTSATTEADILDFYHRKTPLESCKMCTGGRMGGTPWHQSGNLEEWIKDSTA